MAKAKLTLLEMVAYKAVHSADDAPWRCVKCEVLTRHSDDGIIPHLVGAHNLVKDTITTHPDGTMFMVTTEEGTTN